MKFDEIAQLSGEPIREVQFDLPQHSVPILRMIEGFEDFNPSLECLDMTGPGFGLMDAPRWWTVKLTSVLTNEQNRMTSTQADSRVFVRHGKEPSASIVKLEVACSTHVDDVKGTGDPEESNVYSQTSQKNLATQR